MGVTIFAEVLGPWYRDILRGQFPNGSNRFCAGPRLLCAPGYSLNLGVFIPFKRATHNGAVIRRRNNGRLS